MRLGYLVPEFPSQTHIFFWREITAMREEGVQVELISTRRPQSRCMHAFAEGAAAQTTYLYPPDWASDLFSCVAHPGRTISAMSYLASLKETSLTRRAKLGGLVVLAQRLVKFAQARGLDHIHGHSCADVAHLLALTNRMCGLPYSLTLHGDLPVYGVDHRAKMQRAKFVSAVTKPLQEQITTQVGLPVSRVPVIWMGAYTQRMIPTKPRAMTAGQLHVATVARLNLVKGHRFVFAAMAKLRDQGIRITYSVAGQGPHQQEIEAEIARLKLQDQVKMLGSLSEDQVVALLHDVDAFALPSVGLGEAAPVSVMEAMASGLPVICSIIGGTPDMIDHDVDGLLTPQEDVNAIAAALEKLATQPEERARLGQAAMARAARDFDYRANARKLLAAMQSPGTSPAPARAVTSPLTEAAR